MMHKRIWLMLGFFVCLGFFCLQVEAQDRGLTIPASSNAVSTIAAERRSALVIGNSAYESAPLRNPINDARAMGKVLEEMGFEVVVRENLTQKEMKREIQLFGQNLLKGGVGLFYYAGHGMQVNGRNYLIPVGAAIDHEKQVEYEAVDAGSILGEMDHARNRLNIVILDACRDNPFARSFRSGAQGLATMNAPTGTLVAYATSPGAVANDGQGENGLYTGELIRVMQSPGLKIEDVFKGVRSAVREATKGSQIPWEASSLEGDFYFKLPNSKLAYENMVEKAPVTSMPQLSRSEAPARALKVWKEPATGMEFVWVPPGCFLMGSPHDEKGRDSDESPVHEVCLNGFWMGKTEVTNGQFRKFRPEHNCQNYEGHSLNGDNQPAVLLNWLDAVNFAQWLQTQNGTQYKFRLPSEAEWEYAARAGTEDASYWEADPQRACSYENVADETANRLWAWEEVYACDDGYAATAPVASFLPNAFGLNDMLGNIREWCEDVYAVDAYIRHERKNPRFTDENGGSDRVIRGGHWHGGRKAIRIADRTSGAPMSTGDDLGFRLIREP